MTGGNSGNRERREQQMPKNSQGNEYSYNQGNKTYPDKYMGGKQTFSKKKEII